MNDRAFGLARVGYFENRARRRLDNAAVSYLAAAFGIEGRLRDDDCDVIAISASRREHFGLALVAVIADEARRGARAETDLRCDGVILARRASALFLLVHQAVEAREVHVDRMIAQHVLGQVERKAVGVVELERHFARQCMTTALLDAREFRVNQLQAAIECLAKARFLLRDHVGSLRCRSFDLRIRGAHRLDHARMRHREERAMDSEIAAVTRGAPNDPAQHVLAIGVAGHDAVGNQKRHRARMVSDRAKRDVALFLLAVTRLVAELLRGLFDFVHDRLEQIDVVVAEDLARLKTLQRCRGSLEPGAGVDVLLRQRSQYSAAVAVVLNENQVAELDEALASVDIDEAFLARVILFGTARGLAAVDADFRVGTAWPGLAHLPEIILVAELQNPIARQHVQLDPDVLGLLVILVNGRVEQARIDSPDLGDQVPMPANCLFLVVVAKRPIPEHLEKRVMVSVAANRFEIVMLARDAQAFLTIRDAHMWRRAQAEEIVLERHHAGVGEEQGGVALGNQRRRRHDRVTALGEEI